MSLPALASAGFQGFRRIGELWSSGCADVPDAQGVYVLVRDSVEVPSFLSSSPAGRFKGRDPTVTIERLQEEWVPGASVVYIGKAGGASSKATLRQRVTSYLRFGRGARAGHWGGRLVWQLADAESLLVAWKTTEAEDARSLEARMLEDFVRDNGRLPFANLRG